ncbi:MAG TPA: sulfite exporter TauE/SafE family protein, partial [Candidatus Xenobia bacterium]
MFLAVTLGGAVVAGFLGALTGLGGGVVLVPMLVLGLGVELHYAAGASLVSVIATSSGAAAAYVREGWSNLRVGMLLEVATTLGALGGAHLAAYTSPGVLAVILGVVLLFSAFFSGRERPAHAQPKPDPLGQAWQLDGTYPGPDHQPVPYHVRRVPAGFGLMAFAGAISGLLGIGS